MTPRRNRYLASRRERSPAGSGASRPSDRADIGQALLRQRHAGGDVARLSNVEIERENRLLAVLLGPADQPAKRRLAYFSPQQSGLGVDQRVAKLGDQQDIADPG